MDDEENDDLEGNLWQNLVGKIVATVANMYFWFNREKGSETTCSASHEYTNEHLGRALEDLRKMTRELQIRLKNVPISQSSVATTTLTVEVSKQNIGTDLSYPVPSQFCNATTQRSKTNLEDKHLQIFPDSMNICTQKRLHSICADQEPLKLVTSESQTCNQCEENNKKKVNMLVVSKPEKQEVPIFVPPVETTSTDKCKQLKISRKGKITCCRIPKKLKHDRNMPAVAFDKIKQSTEWSENKVNKENDVDTCCENNTPVDAPPQITTTSPHPHPHASPLYYGCLRDSNSRSLSMNDGIGNDYSRYENEMASLNLASSRCPGNGPIRYDDSHQRSYYGAMQDQGFAANRTFNYPHDNYYEYVPGGFQQLHQQQQQVYQMPSREFDRNRMKNESFRGAYQNPAYWIAPRVTQMSPVSGPGYFFTRNPDHVFGNMPNYQQQQQNAYKSSNNNNNNNNLNHVSSSQSNREECCPVDDDSDIDDYDDDDVDDDDDDDVDEGAHLYSR